MTIPNRILRERANLMLRAGRLYGVSEGRERAQMLEVATDLFATYGPAQVTFAKIADALIISPAKLRKYFADIDALFMQILLDHVIRLQRVLGEAANETPSARRALYLRETRFFAALTPIHRLLVMDRQNLPPDLRVEINAARDNLETLLGDTSIPCLLDLLDAPHTNATNVERLMADIAVDFIPILDAAPPPAPPPPEILRAFRLPAAPAKVPFATAENPARPWDKPVREDKRFDHVRGINGTAGPPE